MSLTLGPAPLGNKPAGVFKREPERDGLLYLEPSPRRIRGIAGNVTVIDSLAPRMLHEHGRLPIYLSRGCGSRRCRKENVELSSEHHRLASVPCCEVMPGPGVAPQQRLGVGWQGPGVNPRLWFEGGIRS